jgi:hypothetical protein
MMHDGAEQDQIRGGKTTTASDGVGDVHSGGEQKQTVETEGIDRGGYRRAHLEARAGRAEELAEVVEQVLCELTRLLLRNLRGVFQRVRIPKFQSRHPPCVQRR